MIPTVAIVGRPNVGKSTLFNSLTKSKRAIISPVAGTTRDRVTSIMEMESFDVLLVDTGGLEDGSKGLIEENVQMQAKIAIQDADLVVFVVNLAEELTSDDYAAADILRKSKKPIILAANKCDNQEIEKNIFGLFELGFGEALKMSTIHKTGLDILRGTIEGKLKALKFKRKKVKKNQDVSICILGKPNAGKSSLVNALLGSDKVIVSEIAGTTRDSIDTELTYQNRTFNLIDTAGLRRRGKIEKGIEKFSVLRAIQAIERSDVVVLLIDGEKGISSQDTHIAAHALEAKKGVILAVNKIDLLEVGDEVRDRIFSRLRRKFVFIPWAPVVFVSAKNKRNIFKILDISLEIMDERMKRVPTAELNAFMQKVTFKHMPASRKIRKPKFMYATQPAVDPPTFTLFIKNHSDLHFSYPRYLENKIREEYGFIGTAIDIKFKNGSGEQPKK